MTCAYEGHDILVNSEEFNDMKNKSAVIKITEKLKKLDMGYAI